MVDDYKTDIFTYATIQNFLGGTPIDLMSKTGRDDQQNLGIGTATCTSGSLVQDYYERRASYFIMQLMDEIPFRDLEYEKSNVGIWTTNSNLPPTTFVEKDASGVIQNVYVFYTNVKDQTQKYAIDPGSLVDAIDGATYVTLGAATIYALNPTDLYSTAGRNGICGTSDATDPINSWYNCDEGTGTHEYDFEITSNYSAISGTSCPGGFTPPTGGVCVTVPATSAGYFVIPVTAYRLGQIEDIYGIYPNPSSNYFIVQQKGYEGLNIDNIAVEIYNIYGGLIKSVNVSEGDPIDITQLPVGVYTVIMKTEGLKTESESLIKMK